MSAGSIMTGASSATRAMEMILPGSGMVFRKYFWVAERTVIVSGQQAEGRKTGRTVYWDAAGLEAFLLGLWRFFEHRLYIRGW